MLHGREAVREFLEPDVLAAARFEALEVVEGERVIMVRGVFRATGAASGIGFDVEASTVYKLNDEGLAWRVESWSDRADPERSAGLRFAARTYENGSSSAISASRGAVASRCETCGSASGHSTPTSGSSQAIPASVPGS